MDRNKLFFLAMVCCLGCGSPHTQTNFWSSPAAYLGQKPPSDTPIEFAPGLLAKKDTFSMDRVAFSDDGKEFYYPTNNTWFDGKAAKVRYFKFESGKWNGPFVLNEHYYAPTFSVDGNTLYLLGGKGDGKHAFVYQSKRMKNGWSEPSVYLKKGYGLYDFMPTGSGVCYVGSNAHQGSINDFSTYDICELKMSPTDTSIRSLGAPMNTPGFDGDFFVARDESYIIVSAKESKTYECELYISFHKPDKTWTIPVSLGPLINNGEAHRWGQYVSPDGKYLFYSTGHSATDCHVVWVRFDRLLEKLKKENL
ncbi:MAG: hypothetical protein ACXVB0_03200 [Mucilaginibacter sp.]